MREILFRGKRVENGGWVEGDLVNRTDSDGSKNFLIENNDFNDYRSYEVTPESVGQFTGLTDKNGKKIFEGDEVRYRIPYRTTQTHTGDNIPNGSYTEPMEPGIKEIESVVTFKSSMFSIDNYDGDDTYASPLQWCEQSWDLESIKEAISYTRQSDGWFDDPEEGDLQYLIKEVAMVETEDQLINYLSGLEIIGNIHDNPELLNPS